MAGHRAEVSRDVRAIEERAAPRHARFSAGVVRSTAAGSASGAGRAVRSAHRSGGETRVRPIHQVLATLGYGDAIGHEVLGIQRVLREAGYESEIFVETADHRLESQTHDYSELVDVSHPD